ncbi:MAG: hypothetical protein GY851_31135, partial [bacterium]|nr:hypothetical protein [bacterium]
MNLRNLAWPLVVAVFVLVLCPFVHAATVTWDGGGDGTSWEDPLNWSGDVLPVNYDDVTIDVAGQVVSVTAVTGLALGSLQCEEDFSTSANLTVYGPSAVNGPFTMTGGSALRATGAGVRFDANGPAVIDGSSIYALNGGIVAFASLPSFATADRENAWLQADGAGSLLDLSSVQSLVGPQQYWDSHAVLRIEALNGGHVDLSSAVSMERTCRATVSGDPASTVDLSSLQWIDGCLAGAEDKCRFVAVSGTILVPALVTATYVEFELCNGGTMSLPALSAGISCSFRVTDGRTLSAPVLTSLSSLEFRGSELEAADAGSVLDLSSLLTIVGPYQTWDQKFCIDIAATGGASVDLSSTVTMQGACRTTANGFGNLIDFAALQSVDSSSSSKYNTTVFYAGNGGTIVLPSLEAVTYTDFELHSAGILALPSLTSGTSASFKAYNGMSLVAPSLTTLSSFDRNKSTILAEGTGSSVGMPALATIVGPGQSWDNLRTLNITASGGGAVSLAALTYANGPVAFLSTGIGSQIDVPLLHTIDANNVRTGASIRIDQGGDLNAPSVTTLLNTALYAYDGLTLDLSSATTYIGSTMFTENPPILASGLGTRIDLSGVTNFVGHNDPASRMPVNCEGGAVIDISSTTAITGRVNLGVTGLNSRLLLNSLEVFHGYDTDSISVSQGGVVELNPAVTELRNLSLGLSSSGALKGTVIAGTLEMDSSSELTGNGLIQGTLVNAGIVRPGGPPGSLELDGSFVQTGTGTVEIEIGGTTPDVLYDQLAVTGQVDLAGSLILSLTNGFIPELLDTFDVLLFDTRTGEFGTYNGTDLGGGRTLKAIYRPHKLVIGEVPGLITPPVDAVVTNQNIPVTRDLSVHVGEAVQPNWSVAPSDTALFTASIDGGDILTITPKFNAFGSSTTTLTLTDLSDGFDDQQVLDITVNQVLPTAPGAAVIFPQNPIETESLFCAIQAGMVAALLSPQYEYVWTSSLGKNLPPRISAALVNQLEATDTEPDEVWTCTVRTFDGTYYSAGSAQAVSDAVVGLAESTLTLSVVPQSITLGESVTISGGVEPVVQGEDVFFSDTATPPGPSDTKPGTQSTDVNGLFSDSFIPDEAGAWAFTAEWLGNDQYLGDVASSPLTVSKAQPSLTLTLNASSAAMGYDELEATATMSAGLPAQLAVLLSGVPLKLWVKKPDASPAGPVLGVTDGDGVAVFDAAAFASAGIVFNEPGLWQFMVEFEGDDNFLPATSPGYDQSDSTRLTIKDRAGYAIVVVGKYDHNGEGVTEHAKTGDAVYRAMIKRGLTDDDILYMREAPQQQVAADIFVDNIAPSQAALQTAIETWAANKMTAAAAPLYVVLLDHGSEWSFYVYLDEYDETRLVTSFELDGYLDVLEGKLDGAALAEPRVVVYGACHSGSFIDHVSAP